MLDKKIIKEKLEAERDILLGQLRDIGKLNPRQMNGKRFQKKGILGNQTKMIWQIDLKILKLEV